MSSSKQRQPSLSSQVGWLGRGAQRRNLHHEAPPSWSQNDRGTILTWEWDPEERSERILRTKGMLEVVGVRGHRDSVVARRQETGDPHDGLTPGYVVSCRCHFPARSHGTG